jgi:hypothetical protein
MEVRDHLDLIKMKKDDEGTIKRLESLRHALQSVEKEIIVGVLMGCFQRKKKVT